MPTIGEIKRGREIQRNKTPSDKFIWARCLDCNKERWVLLRKNNLASLRCLHCRGRGERSPNWRGGTIYYGKYRYIKLQPEEFFYSMANYRGYVAEHRLIVAKAMGRNLHLWEIVHHKKGFAKDDNRYPETLQLVTDDRHNQITILETRIKYLEGILLKEGINFNGK